MLVNIVNIASYANVVSIYLKPVDHLLENKATKWYHTELFRMKEKKKKMKTNGVNSR